MSIIIKQIVVASMGSSTNCKDKWEHPKPGYLWGSRGFDSCIC